MLLEVEEVTVISVTVVLVTSPTDNEPNEPQRGTASGVARSSTFDGFQFSKWRGMLPSACA